MSTSRESRLLSGSGKYRSLAISITILVLLIVALLLLNLYLSDSIRTGGQTTAAIGRQSALINQVSKDLFLIESRLKQDIPVDEEKVALKTAINTFDETLLAFSFGGTITMQEQGVTTTGELYIDALDTRESSLVLFEAQKIWSWYKESVDPLFADTADTRTEILNARDISEKYTARLAYLMDIISGQIRQKITGTLNTLRIAQIIGIALTAFMLVWTIFITVRNLRKNDEALDHAREETTGILNTVKEGLFLLDRQFVVSGQYSAEMKEILETDDIGGRKFTDLLEHAITSSEMETVREFIKLLFDEEKIEGLIESLNPLEQVEVNFFGRDHGDESGDHSSVAISKHLNFSFYRVKRADAIRGVLVSVRDITEQVNLERELEAAQKQGDEQIEMLVSFIHAEPKVMAQFLAESRHSFNDINRILKEPVSDKRDFKNKIEKMLVQVHRMKGEAASLDFEEFANKAHHFEDDLITLKSVRTLAGMDFLPLVIQLDSMITYTDKLKEISQRLHISSTELTRQGNEAGQPGSEKRWQHLHASATKIAAENNKSVQLVMTGFAETTLSDRQQSFINHVGVQLLRNAIVHGIESPQERLQQGKPAEGRIDFRVSQLHDKSLEIVIRDDGRGLDIKKIREQLIANGHVTKSELQRWSDARVAGMVFKTGFSTREQADMHSGRGFGLDIVRDNVKRLNGKLRLNQKTGNHCQFEITLPNETVCQTASFPKKQANIELGRCTKGN